MRITLLGLFVATVPVLANANTAPDISGDWSRADGNARVHIAPCGAQICATNTWIRDPSKGESVGDRLVMTLAADGDARFVGTAFDEKRNLHYSMEISVNRDQMKAHGCVIKHIACKTMDWTRAQ